MKILGKASATCCWVCTYLDGALHEGLRHVLPAGQRWRLGGNETTEIGVSVLLYHFQQAFKFGNPGLHQVTVLEHNL